MSGVSATKSPLLVLQVPSNEPKDDISVVPGRPLFLLGRNGVGKSALVHYFRRQLGVGVVYMPGSRASYFESEGLSLSEHSRTQLIQNMHSWDMQPDIRWRPVNGASRNEKAIHGLISQETQYKLEAAEQIVEEGETSSAIAKLQRRDSPLDRLNALLKRAGIHIAVKIERGNLFAVKGEHTYSVAKMSDGERALLIFASEIISAAASSIILIDEPELHLHRAIVVPFIAALVTERADCGFVISTHELDLPSGVDAAQILLVRRVEWENGEARRWEYDLIEDSMAIPESLRRDLLGARKKILFIEGNGKSSLDQPLYEILFPSISICPRETCSEILRAVRGLRSVEELHRTLAFGLIDHDGMSEKSRAEYQAENIFVLPIFSVESLIYCQDTIKAVSQRQAETFGLDVNRFLDDVVQAGMRAFDENSSIEHLAARLAERRMRDLLVESMPSRDEIKHSTSENISISIKSPFLSELGLIHRALEQQNIYAIIARYPVRETGVLTAIAKALKFSSRQDYEAAALSRIAVDQELQDALRRNLGELAFALSAP